ncbi:uncharacterized protein DUF4269 [Taibaiella chishuiensis]|uniref:Uncharacterized protein DUF4269 n=2 Tax=Taibaiella chishuiensis TaxID=1434707 RepID=A0A2P8DDM4_9BACT|nr:uncharacterized protein DUF4269 [Taibaiella chishuiensis]
MDFTDITYLRQGNTRQQQAYAALTEFRIMEQLQGFTPVLAGTIPLAIDISGSDLDILCCFSDATRFTTVVTARFGQEAHFKIRTRQLPEGTAIIAGFICGGFEIEVFGQQLAVTQQQGYRHMLAEYRLLLAFGPALRQQVIDLKNQGYKTEPAFARALGLPGDPYRELLRPDIVAVAQQLAGQR